MVEKWRPKDWEDITKKYIGHRGTDFEFGADAMLESLKREADNRGAKIARIMHHAMSKKNGRDPEKEDGFWVFIPESRQERNLQVEFKR